MSLSTDFEAIEALDLDPIKVKLMHVESGEGWSLEKANAVEREYRRFLYLMKTFPNEQTAPLMDVDTFWHYHILDTMKYAVDCQAVFGYFLHHFPYIGLRGEDDLVAHERVGKRMAEIYEETFGESYAQAATAFSGAATATAFSGAATAKTAFSGAATKTAFSGAATAKTAFSGAATKTAFSGAATAKTAFSGAASKTAFSGAATAQTAFSGAATKTAFSGAATAQTAFSGAATATAFSGAATKTAFSGASMADQDAFFTVRPTLKDAVNESAPQEV